jgi:hypothetical protein
MLDRQRVHTANRGLQSSPGPIKKSKALLAASIWLLGLCSPAFAQTPRTKSDDAWLPGISVSLQVSQQRAEGSISSTLATDTVSNSDPTPVPLSSDKHDNYFVPIIPIAFQLESPTLELPEWAGRPRASIEAAYHFIPSVERDFIVDGKFVTIPPNPTAASQGLGGQLRIGRQHQWSVSAGLSFPFEVFDSPIHIRPSISYLGQWVRADMKAIGVQIGTDTLLNLGDDASKALHYLGPRLTLEADAGRMADTRFVFFFDTAAYFSRVAGDQVIRGRDISAGETAQFEYEPDSLLFQVGIGVRVVWDPRR